VKRVVIVGNKISPGNTVTKPDGTVVRTLWGELAWQLGGKPAFERLRADDEKATSPGDVLRLMTAVIHGLWERGDRSPMILPANIPIDEPRVQFELTRYLSDNWVPVLGKDVDGPNSLPLRIDGEVPNLGKFSACRRVARTIYLGSAPTAKAANRGLEDRRVKLGCVQPGESPAIFGDALRRMSAQATYLYSDGARYWYDTQPTVTKLADDRAEQLKSDPHKVTEEIKRRLDQDTRQRGDFSRVHVFPASSADVPDDPEVYDWWYWAPTVPIGARASRPLFAGKMPAPPIPRRWWSRRCWKIAAAARACTAMPWFFGDR
jgi:predicted AAA+ superfamily ATPase